MLTALIVRRAPMIECKLFEIRLNAGTMQDAVMQIMQHASQQVGGMVCVANVDMVTRAKRTPRLAQLMSEATLVVTDGMPLVWALRHLRRLPHIERVNGPRLTLELCRQAAADGTGVFLYGGSEAELQGMQKQLLAMYPTLQICGAVSPPLLPTEPPRDDATITLINDSGAQLVLVGLGCPKQEYWMQAQQGSLKALAIGVGFAFALIAGNKKEAPAWMRRHGLEWLFRLMQEPRRLWKRYLVGNTLFFWYLARELLRQRKDLSL